MSEPLSYPSTPPAIPPNSSRTHHDPSSSPLSTLDANSTTGDTPHAVNKRWSIENATDHPAKLMLDRNRLTFELARALAPPSLDFGFDEHYRRHGSQIGLSRWQADKYATMGLALRHLPLVRAFLAQRPVLSFDHLRHVCDTVFPLDEQDPAEAEIIAQVDIAVADWLEPRIENQTLPTPRALLHHLKRLMEELAPEYRPIDPKEKPKPKPPRPGEYGVDDRDENTSTFHMTLPKAEAEIVKTAVDKVAAREGITKAEALTRLIEGSASVSSTLHLYVNADAPGVWAERIGWLTPYLAQPLLDRITQIEFVDGKPRATEAYQPTAEQVRWVHARDGGCRAPGCDVPAHKCQIDHIIPFDAGGKTDVDNLHCLCSKHHQLKTARYAALLMAFSGVQAWAGHDSDDVTYTVPEGPLSNHYPMMNFGHMKQAHADRVMAHNERRAEEAAEEAAAAGEEAGAAAETGPVTTSFDAYDDEGEPPF